MNCYFLESTAFAKLFVRAAGTDELIRLMEVTEDNRKLISASSPLEIYAAVRRCERAGEISPENAASALEILSLEAARMVQQPLNPAVLESARQLIDRTSLRWPETLQLASAMVAREMFQGTEIVFVSSSSHLIESAKAEGFQTLDPAREPVPADAAKAGE